MEQTVIEEATEVAKSMAGNSTRVEHLSGDDEERVAFGYCGGVIHAHQMPDEWSIIGFGGGWFALRKR